MTVVAALGDSFTCGEGVGVRVDPEATWAALLADALPGGRLVSLAVAGARIADVRARQLPLLPGHVDVATLVIGLNDVARSGFDPPTVTTDLENLVSVLRGRADEVLLGRLHDPLALLPLPSRIAHATRRRIEVIHAVVDEVARLSGVSILDLGAVPALAQPGGWSVDRIHPSVAGHRGMAVSAIEALRPGGRHRPSPLAVPVVPPGPTRLDRSRWMVRHGVPYAAGHLREIGAPLASAVLGRGRGGPALRREPQAGDLAAGAQ